MPIDDAVEAMEAARPDATVAPAPPVVREAGLRSIFGWLTQIKELNILIALLLLSAFLGIRPPVFLTTDNLLGVARAVSLTAIASIGETMAIITGGIDPSVGSIIGLSGVSTWLLLAAGILVGVGFGLGNGLLVARIGLPPFLATIEALSNVRGLVHIITKGYPVTIPTELVWLTFLSQSAMGRNVYVVGGNEEALRLVGNNIGRVTLTVYAICGLLAAVGWLIRTSRLVSAQPSAGLGSELPINAAVVIGGASLLGGEGTVLLNIITYATRTATDAMTPLAGSIDI